MPGLWTVARYGSPGFTLAFAALPLYLLTPALYAEQLGLSLGAVGIVLMLTRLTDAIADPIIGRWMDQHSTGLWQWLWLGLAVMAIGLSLLVNPPAWLHEASPSGGLMFLWMGLCALIVSLANSVATLAHQSWAVAWTAELRSQSRLIAAREFWALIGVIVAAVIYFVIVLPYKKLRERGEVEQAQDTELSLLTEIRDLLVVANGGTAGKHVTGPGTGPSPDTAVYTSADRSDKQH